MYIHIYKIPAVVSFRLQWCFASLPGITDTSPLSCGNLSLLFLSTTHFVVTPISWQQFRMVDGFGFATLLLWCFFLLHVLASFELSILKHSRTILSVYPWYICHASYHMARVSGPSSEASRASSAEAPWMFLEIRLPNRQTNQRLHWIPLEICRIEIEYVNLW